MSTPLWATVADLLDSVSPSGTAAETIRVESVRVDLPVDVTFRATQDGVEVLGSLPRWRLRTAFDRPPGRMRIDVRREMPAETARGEGTGDRGQGTGDRLQPAEARPEAADPYDFDYDFDPPLETASGEGAAASDRAPSIDRSESPESPESTEAPGAEEAA